MERTGFRPLYLVPILYVASIYVFPFWSTRTTMKTDPDSLDMSMLPIVIILAIANIVVALVARRTESRAFLLNCAVLVKYALVPFFLVGGALVALTALSSLIPVPFMIFVMPWVALMLAAVGWLLMVCGSSYSLAYIKVSKREGARSVLPAGLHALLQFIFVADVISVMVLTWRERRWRGLTVVVAIVMAMVTIALLVLLAWLVSTFAMGVATSAAS